MTAFPIVGAETVLLARTVAFLGKRPLIIYSLSACLVAATAYQNWVVFKPMFLIPFVADDRYGVCLPSSPGYEMFGFFLSSLLFDTLVTVFMVYQVFKLRREAGGQFSRSPLVQLFVSEGLWYFVVVSVANLINGLMFTQKEKTLQPIAVPFSYGTPLDGTVLKLTLSPRLIRNMLPTILACRLILDLREHGSAQGNAWLTTGKGNVGFVLPAFLYRSKPGPTPPHISTVRFQNPHNIHSLHPGISATDNSGASTISDVQFVKADAASHKTSFLTGSTSIGVAEVGDEDEVVNARDVSVSTMKSEEEEAGTLAGVDSELDLAYQMRPVRSHRETASKNSQEERRGDNLV
ncbi:hypothetical protein FRC04_006748 [Tulasnella sp. 424]|nr:hypothetical protein FRC04_006748 [Tulasnella sp. 424]KAG8974299.1 hypothetical protein FRC05_007605 [Tulasnella sp. 425]